MEEINETNISLQLGDIIEIISPDDLNLHNKSFIINYIDKEKIKLLNLNGETILNLKSDFSFDNESIQNIILLSRAEYQGFARQNNLFIDTWIDIYFSGDVPLTLTGKITNLEEDQIEIQLYESNEIIYIDFAYKGLPEDIPIEKIIIRDKPIELQEEKQEQEQKQEEKQEQEQEQEEKQEQEQEQAQEEKQEQEQEQKQEFEINKSLEKEDILKERLNNLIIEADQIIFGEKLQVLKQEVEVTDDEKRYNINKQTEDLLNELLSDIPNQERNSQVLNNIHKMIERYKQLRKRFSVFDENNIVIKPLLNGANYKPLLNNLKSLNKKLYWLLPVVKNKKKVYDLEDVEDNFNDIELLTLKSELEEENDNDTLFKTNKLSGNNENFDEYIKTINEKYTPFINNLNKQDIIYSKEVETNIESVIDNLENFYSSIYKSDNIKKRRFVLQSYNLGINKLEKHRILGGEFTYKLKRITKSDTIDIKSFLSLPKSAILFSHINLPSTNLINKANLNNYFLLYYKFLNTNKQIIENVLNEDFKHDEDNLLNMINEYIPSDDLLVNKNYDMYINKLVPKTRILFNLIKTNIRGKLTVYDIVSALEPFMIYNDDITFKQYQEITDFLREKIYNFKKLYAVNKKVFFDMKNKTTTEKSNTLMQLIENDFIQNLEIYKNIDYSKLTNNELISLFKKIDYSILFNQTYSLANLKLITNIGENIDLNETYNDELESENKSNNCKNKILTKKYLSLEKLEQDNNKDIYVDDEYDNTFYDVINEYSNDLVLFDTYDDKKEFLINKLIENVGMELIDAEIEADSLLNEKRRVVNNNYAVVMNNITDQTRYLYFKRQDNIWVYDEEITEQIQTLNQTEFCNATMLCYSTNKKCNTIDLTRLNRDIDLAKQINIEINIEKQNIRKNIVESIDNLKKRIFKINKILDYNSNKHDYTHFNIGLEYVDNEIIISPYTEILGLILKQDDFIKKQLDIEKFTLQFTRPAIESNNEDKWWLYCIETSTKLLPVFVNRLAKTFNKKDDYSLELKKIISEQGTLSSDGDCIVDKYSGWKIDNIQFSDSDNYDEKGFIIKTRDILEQDLGEKIIEINDSSKKQDEYTNVLDKKIINVIRAISKYIYIDLTNNEKFILHETKNQLQITMPSKEKYELASKKAAIKGKKYILSYEDNYNQSLIIFTISYILISIQTNIPDIKTRKTFPGCVKSFSGYPFLNDGDKSGITYISCVTDKIKSLVEPWNSLKKLNQKKILAKMETFLDKFIINSNVIKQKINNKLEYNLKNKVVSVEEVYTINKWTTFLPPLNETVKQLKRKINKKHFIDILSSIKSSSPNQFKYIQNIRSKIIYFTLNIKNQIDNLIKKDIEKESALLLTSNQEPFLENACCNNNYFIEYDNKIEQDINSIKHIEKILNFVKNIETASILFNNLNTKRKFSEIPNTFDEMTIYEYFINKCKLNQNKLIPDNLKIFCREIPENYNKYDTIENQVKFLKENNIIYNLDDLNQFINFNNKNNTTNIKIKDIIINNIQKQKDILQYLDDYEVDIIPKIFRKHMNKLLDKFDINNLTEDVPEMRNMKNYLSESNNNMIIEIQDFISKYLSKKKYNEITNCLENINEFILTGDNKLKEDIDETLIKYISFIKTNINFIGNIITNIIKNNVNYSNSKINKNWKLSEKHENDIKHIINSQYSSLYQFFNDKDINNVVSRLNINFKIIISLINQINFILPVKLNEIYYYSIFDRRMINYLFKYFYLLVIKEFINILDNNDIYKDEDILEPSVATLNNNQEIEIILGKKEDFSQKISNLLYEIIKISCNTKNNINYNYTTLKEKIIRAKEKEKDSFTNKLMRMSDEERQVDNFHKMHKLQEWGVAQQKGFHEYDATMYDKERVALEQQTIMEIKLNKKDGVTEMNMNIYAMDEIQNEINNKLIEQEEYDMSHIGEDNDNYGEIDEEDF